MPNLILCHLIIFHFFWNLNPTDFNDLHWSTTLNYTFNPLPISNLKLINQPEVMIFMSQPTPKPTYMAPIGATW